MKLFLCTVLLAMSLSATAKNCEEGADNMGMVRGCLIEESAAPIKPAFNALLKGLGDNKEAVDALKKAQDDWAKFRDSTCDYIYAVSNMDESASCAIDFNTARVKVLKKYLKDAKNP